MNTHSLAEKIFSDIQDRKSSTLTILRDARAFGRLLGVSDYLWIDNELTGYQGSTFPIPSYRTVDAIEKKVWVGNIPQTLLYTNSEWLYSTRWLKWTMLQPVSVLEDLVSTGAQIDTGIVLKTLNSGYLKKEIKQEVKVHAREIKRILDFIQDRVQAQVTDYLAQPSLSKPSLGILSIYMELFPNLTSDLANITEYLESGNGHLSAARSSRSILISLAKTLVAVPKPKDYLFADKVPLTNFGDKSKIKLYLESKGRIIFNDPKKLLKLDELYREVYDMGSKALKDDLSIYETNLCLDNLLKFMEQLYRYTDLEQIN